MNVIVLNKRFESIGVIDQYISLLWVVKYYGAGDLEMVLPASLFDKEILAEGNYLTIRQNETREMQGLPVHLKGYKKRYRLMVIETIETKTDIEEGDTVTITGRSLSSILDRRVIWDGWQAEDICLSGLVYGNIWNNVISPNISRRKIENFECRPADSFDPPKKIEGHLLFWGENLYDIIYEHCVAKEVGFDVFLLEFGENSYRDFCLYLDLYEGVDHSYDQTDRPYVVFSPKYDNFLSSKAIESKVDLKNAVLVLGENQQNGMVNASDLDLRYASTPQIENLFSQYPIVNGNVQYSSTMSTRANNDYEYNPNPEITDNNVTLTEVPIVASYSGEEEGLDRREMSFHSSLTSTYYGTAEEAVALQMNEYLQALQNEGKKELENHQVTAAYEGEIQAEIQFVLGRDFEIGDIVQTVNGYGIESVSRIIEIVYSSDVNGEKIYPTFSVLEKNSERNKEKE